MRDGTGDAGGTESERRAVAMNDKQLNQAGGAGQRRL